jgi:hypothetical protein
MKAGFEGRALDVTIPRDFLGEFEEARIIFPPYPGLLILDRIMLRKVQELMNLPDVAERFDVVLVPKM